MGDCLLCQLNACLAVLLDDVASDVWLTLFSLAYDSVVSTCLDVISPDNRRADLTLIAPYNPDSIFMTFFDDIVHDT